MGGIKWEIGMDIYTLWWFGRSAVFNSCNPMDYKPPRSSVHGIFQARIMEWAAISLSNIHTTIFITKITNKDYCTAQGTLLNNL